MSTSTYVGQLESLSMSGVAPGEASDLVQKGYEHRPALSSAHLLQVTIQTCRHTMRSSYLRSRAFYSKFGHQRQSYWQLSSQWYGEMGLNGYLPLPRMAIVYA